MPADPTRVSGPDGASAPDRALVPPGPFVDERWLSSRLDRVIVADVRWYLDDRDAHAEYVSGHLPGAVFVDLDRDLAAPPSIGGGRHPLPAPTAFATAMARLGIGDGDVVVAYDQGPGAMAARLVWMLRRTDRTAAVLEGGLAGWSGPIETGAVTRPSAAFTPRPWPAGATADADEVAALARDPHAVVIDARDPERYRGDHEPVDARPGHVPGAVNVPYRSNVDPGTGRLRSSDDLGSTYAAAGVREDRDVVVYCGSGVSACHDVLVLEGLGVDARLFVGSWSAWSADTSRPAAVGDGRDAG